MHSLELATTGRATCRGCGQKIAAKTVRLGESVPNTFADDGGMTTHWYHPTCGALRRPEAFLAALAASRTGPPHGEALHVEHMEQLRVEAEAGLTHHRLPRVSTASRAPTGRATCRGCKALIEKDSWRIALVYYEEGRFSPSGYIHAACAGSYLETTDVLWRIHQWSPALSQEDMGRLAEAIS